MGESERAAGEARWPMAAAVATAMVLTVLAPDPVRLGPPWLLPSVEGVLLVALVAGDPGRIDGRSRVLRLLSIGLVSVLVVGALAATVRLTAELIQGGPVSNSPSRLLEAGSIVWTSNIIAFALLYWELDGGGSAARTYRVPRYPDLAFPQHSNPNLAQPGWRPRFVDYLYLGFTNATAFSPTDTMPLAAWAKMAMTVQSVISLVVLGLVVARAVNVFR